MLKSIPTLLTRTTLITLLASSTFLSADIYRWVDDQGNVHFSDSPQDHKNAEKITIKPVTTMAFPKPGTSEQPPATSDDKGAGYKKAIVLSPANDSAFYSNSGSVQISISSDPALEPTHSYTLVFDNQSFPMGRSSSHQLENVERGTHTVRVDIYQGSQKIFEGQSSSFTVHKHTQQKP